MINWKGAARWYRARFRSAMQGIDHRTQLAAAEHEKRVMLVNAMWDLLPKIVASDNPHWCVACRRPLLKWGHHQNCPYIAALEAVAEASISPEV